MQIVRTLERHQARLIQDAGDSFRAEEETAKRPEDVWAASLRGDAPTKVAPWHLVIRMKQISVLMCDH
jgi:hypothetical protein